MYLNSLIKAFILVFLYTGLIHAQDGVMHTIVLDEDNIDFANPQYLLANPGDSVKFYANKGAFAIVIEDAHEIFVSEDELHIERTLDRESPTSEVFVFKSPTNDIIKRYTIFCISKKQWPDAPPKIILIEND